MVTSIFKKSNPINFVILIVYLTLVFAIVNKATLFNNAKDAFSDIISFLVLIFFGITMHFIVSKNSLTQKNNYSLLIFVVLLPFFPKAFVNLDYLFSSVFILLSLRSILSLQNNINLKKKLFQAAFWIALATLFYFWAILFFIILLIALLYAVQNDFRNSIMPLLGIASVFILLFIYNIIFFDAYFVASNFNISTDFSFSNYNTISWFIKLTFLSIAILLLSINYFKILNKKSKNHKSSYALLWVSMGIGLLIPIITPYKDGSEFVFLLAPLSILLASFIEIISKKWVKEVLVLLCITVPIISLFL